MSIDGRITVDALFHDTSGSRLKVLSLESSTGYASGKVVRMTATAGTADVTINFANYRNASGTLVELTSPYKLAFAWSGTTRRALYDAGVNSFRVVSSDGETAVTQLFDEEPIPTLEAGASTGTYTLIMWGAS